MPSFLKVIENYFILYSRVFWIIISLLSIVLGMIFLFIGLNKFYFPQESTGNLDIPKWSQIESKIFPPRIQTEKSQSKKNLQITEDGRNLKLPVIEVKNLMLSIHKNFGDTDSNLSNIKFEITLRSLDNYLYSKKIEPFNVEKSELKQVIRGMTDLFDASLKSKKFIKIGSYKDRLNTVYLAIDYYFVEINSQKKYLAAEKNNIEIQNAIDKSQGLTYLTFAAYFIMSFITLVLFIVIFRVESHLKNISNK